MTRILWQIYLSGERSKDLELALTRLDQPTKPWKCLAWRTMTLSFPTGIDLTTRPTKPFASRTKPIARSAQDALSHKKFTNFTKSALTKGRR
jgi:hypothetical protein